MPISTRIGSASGCPLWESCVWWTEFTLLFFRGLTLLESSQHSPLLSGLALAVTLCVLEKKGNLSQIGRGDRLGREVLVLVIKIFIEVFVILIDKFVLGGVPLASLFLCICEILERV